MAMSETVIRTPIQPTPAKVADNTPKEIKVLGDSKATVPYTEYEQEAKHPFEVDYFDLGDNWRDCFAEEVENIDKFFNYLIGKGKIDNSTNAVKIKLREYESMAGVKETDRTVMKVAKLNAYVKFLKDTENIEKYGEKYSL